jgi:hypothetical protein
MAIALSPAERELVITRVFNAPRELVFKAWTDPKLAIRGGDRAIIRPRTWRWTPGPAASGGTA